MKKLLILLWLVPWVNGKTAGAAVPAACHRASAEVNLARECFSNEMHAEADFGAFVNTLETPGGRGYCLGAFVYVPPAHGTEVSVTVVKDDPKGQPHAYTYAYDAAKARRPANVAPLALSFTGLTAKCFSLSALDDACRTGFLGTKRADVPLAVELAPLAPGRPGWKVRAPLVDPARIGDPTGTEALRSRGEIEAKAFDLWLLQLAKQKLLSRGGRGLAGEQALHCRMAFDGFIHAKHLPDPLSPAERHRLEP